MTDEERADEYASSYGDDNIIDFGDDQLNLFPLRRWSFLDGLKAGRPKWHKVVDGDLPKENNLYLVAIKDNGLAIAYFNGLHWETKFNLGDFGHCLETVIAWCEIPKFEEK